MSICLNKLMLSTSFHLFRFFWNLPWCPPWFCPRSISHIRFPLPQTLNFCFLTYHSETASIIVFDLKQTNIFFKPKMKIPYSTRMWICRVFFLLDEGFFVGQQELQNGYKKRNKVLLIVVASSFFNVIFC